MGLRFASEIIPFYLVKKILCRRLLPLSNLSRTRNYMQVANPAETLAQLFQFPELMWSGTRILHLQLSGWADCSQFVFTGRST